MNKLALLLAVTMVAAQATAQTAATPAQALPSTQGKFDPKRDAAKDIANAIVVAKKQNKRILLDVGGNWCIWCKKLDKFFEEDKEAAAILKKSYVVVKINFSPENENKAVLSKYPEIKAYPHLFILDKTGKLLHSQDTGELETGPNHDRTKVIPFLKKWSS